jgi:hypothetical protein
VFPSTSLSYPMGLVLKNVDGFKGRFERGGVFNISESWGYFEQRAYLGGKLQKSEIGSSLKTSTRSMMKKRIDILLRLFNFTSSVLLVSAVTLKDSYGLINKHAKLSFYIQSSNPAYL